MQAPEPTITAGAARHVVSPSDSKRRCRSRVVKTAVQFTQIEPLSTNPLTAKAAVGVAMTFSWAEAHDCFCDHFQVLYPSMLDTCCGGASHRGRC